MNLTELQRKLLTAARSHTPGDNVPYGFQTRVMARLRSAGMPDGWALWAGALWRATVPCVAIVVLLGAWTFLSSPTPAQGDLSQDLENTILAAANQQASDSIW
jgi:hypothetical protein